MGDEKRQKKWTENYLRSFDARYVAAHNAIRQMRKRKKPITISPQDLAESVNMYQPCGETVLLHQFRKRASNNFRQVMEYGPENRARQYVLSNLSKMTTTLDPRQYLFSGGRDGAAREVVRLINQGFVYFVELDIKDYYPSVDEEEAVKLLPVPSEVGMLNLTLCYLNIRRRTKTSNKQAYPLPFYTDHNSPGKAGAVSDLSDTVPPAARQGIPQGAASSPYLTEVLLASVISALPQFTEVVSFADNILLLARTEAELLSAAKTCGRLLLEHPAGPLRPVVKSRGHVSQGLTFLGYQFRLGNGCVEVAPSPDNLDRYQHQFDEALEQIRNNALPYDVRHRRADKISKNIKYWRSSFGISNLFRDKTNSWIADIEAARPKQLVRISYPITDKHIGDL